MIIKILELLKSIKPLFTLLSNIIQQKISKIQNLQDKVYLIFHLTKFFIIH